MSLLGAWLWGSSQLDEAVDKATSELLPAGAEDIAMNLEICDQIRSKSVPAKDAMRALKRRLNHKNPNVQILALGLTDICIKNGGDQFLLEVASREFMDNLVSILKIPGLNHDVKNTILRMVQNWSVAFEGKVLLSYVGQVYKTLKSEGFKFPPQDMALANSAMVDTQTAPEWIESDVCLRCRTAFTLMNRKHHCRNCGQVFDQQCSSKTMPLPHLGLPQEVRVCDSCHSKLTKKGDKADRGHKHSNGAPGSRHRSARELADAELQRAIQLSLEEVNGPSGHARPGYTPSQPAKWEFSEPPLVERRAGYSGNTNTEEDDPDLKAAIEASLREAQAPKPSAPVAFESSRTEEPSWPNHSHAQPYSANVMPPEPPAPKIPNYDLEPLESDVILTFGQMVTQVQEQGGRDMSRYPAVTELYDKANGLRPKLAMSLDDTGRKEEMLSDMHDKLSQVVKLYDQLLTEQVSSPRWRSSPQAARPQHQQAQPSYGAGYNQWAAPSEPAKQPRSPQQTYFAAPPTAEYQTQHAHYSTSSTQVHSPGPPMQQEVPLAQQSSAPPPPAPLSVAHQYSSPGPLSPPQTNHPQQSTSQQPYQVALPQSPPPHANLALSRHNTIANAPPPPASNTNAYLARSQSDSHQRPQQQYQHYAPPPQPALPEFPVAPTSAPQAFSLYGSSVPSGIQPERKEALLIDL